MTTRSRDMAIVGAIVASVGVGFAGGWIAATSGEPGEARARLAAASAATAPAAVAGDGLSLAPSPVRPRAGAPRPPSRGAGEPTADALARSETTPDYETPVDVRPLLDAARAARAAPEDHETCEKANAEADALLGRLLDDPRSLADALDAFRRLDDPYELADLAAVLGQVRDAEVEALALELARAGDRPEHREAAFDILDSFDTDAARAPALDALAAETDVGVRRAAIRAIGEPQGVSQEDARVVTAALARVVDGDRDVESARSAATMLALWAPDERDLAPAFEALLEDPRPAVRAGAAFAFEAAGRRSGAIVQALATALARRDEDPLVRENAYRALRRLAPLPREAHAVYQAYEAERIVAGEGGGIPE